MCDFCERVTEHTLLGVEFCDECFSNAKMCDVCETLHVYGIDLTYNEELNQFICDGCASDLNECPKCGKKHANGEGELCNACKKKYFKCPDCGEIKTHARSTPNALEIAQYPTIQKGICSACFNKQVESGTHEKHNVINCEHCGIITSNEKYCDTCLSELWYCEECGEARFGTPIITATGKKICASCINRYYFKCNCCDKIHHINNFDFKTGICKDCAKHSVQCDNCRSYTREPWKDKNFDLSLCKRCKSLEVNDCKLCGTESMDTREGLCPLCAQEMGAGSIRNYTYKAPMKVKGVLNYGIENEFSVIEGVSPKIGAMHASKCFPSFQMIMKTDSSVTNGFECVFKAMPYTTLKKTDFKALFNTPLFVPHDSCGMHIHMSKKAFTTVHLYKFMNFLHSNEVFIEKIAERKHNRYSYKNDQKITEIAKTKNSRERGMINLQNEHTIEIRMFKGVVDEKSFRKNIEFLDALFYFTQKTPIKNCTVDNFLDYLRATFYKNLKEFLNVPSTK